MSFLYGNVGIPRMPEARRGQTSHSCTLQPRTSIEQISRFGYSYQYLSASSRPIVIKPHFTPLKAELHHLASLFNLPMKTETLC